jgi:hypothetical protein
VACHIPYDWDTHSTAPVGEHDHLYQGKIVFDPDYWDYYDDTEVRQYMSAHEMGHGLGLEDHGTQECSAQTVMGQLSDPACNETPTYWDAIATMDIHGYFE